MIEMWRYLRKPQLTVYCNLFVFRLLGLAPFSVRTSCLLGINLRSNDKKIFSVSKFGYIYNAILTVSMTWLIINSKIYVFPATIRVEELLPKLVGKSLMVFGYAMAVIIWIAYILRQSSMVTIANGIYDSFRVMESCRDIHVKHGNCLMFKWLVFLMSSVYICVVEHIEYSYTSIIVIYIKLSGLVLGWMMLQYSFILDVFRDRFADLNEGLLRIGRVSEEFEVPSFFHRKILINSTVLADIATLRRVHGELCHLCYQVGDNYALLVLLVIIVFSAGSVYNIYFLLIPAISNYPPLLPLITGIGWIVIQLSAVIYLTTSATRVTQAVRRTAHVIHALLDMCSLHPDVTRELKIFSREILAKKFHLNIYDIFILDNSLLSSIAGVKITYLIILIQFLIN
ncbi:putative gustatory receptor 39b [Diachasma alloeum]|uniref:Gustatory receptor n=1 Tax=Diachasma alloeum TaxID=454923 RepID=A0A4E0RN03_9HYME|nr:putative gustatory receptor 39b [Diachasma alloeum]THK33158.1 gustatory receptor 11 [Diachasma alloeum]